MSEMVPGKYLGGIVNVAHVVRIAPKRRWCGVGWKVVVTLTAGPSFTWWTGRTESDADDVAMKLGELVQRRESLTVHKS